MLSDISKKIVGSDAIEDLAKKLNNKIKNYVDEKEFISIVPISIDYNTNKGSIDDDVYLETWTKHPRFILFQNKYYMLEQYRTYEEDGGKGLSDYDFVYGDGHETKLCFKERSDYNFEIKLFEYVDYESHKIAYEHSQELHAPADAQKNSDITQEEIEAKLTGRIYSHNHNRMTFDTNAANTQGTVWDSSTLPVDYERGVQYSFSENQTNKFNGMTHSVVETIKPYGSVGKGTVAHQWIFPYKNEAAHKNKIYTRSILLGESQWGEYAELYTSLNKPTPEGIGAASAERVAELEKGERVYFLPVDGFTTTTGSSTKGAYLSTMWSVNNVEGITTPYDGMTIAIRIPTVGLSTAGVVLSIDGGTTYHPIVKNVDTVLSTYYSVGSTIIVTYNSTQTANAYLTSNTLTTPEGVWQIADYDADTKTRSSNKEGSKMFIIGATSQSSSGQTTYSNKNCYIGTDNCLYSNGEKVASETALNALSEDLVLATDDDIRALFTATSETDIEDENPTESNNNIE